MSISHEKYNVPFTASELLDALHKFHDTAVGPDDIHYQILKHLPDNALETLLNILNDIWITGKFPKAGVKQRLYLYQNQIKIILKPLAIDLFL